MTEKALDEPVTEVSQLERHARVTLSSPPKGIGDVFARHEFAGRSGLVSELQRLSGTPLGIRVPQWSDGFQQAHQLAEGEGLLVGDVLFHYHGGHVTSFEADHDIDPLQVNQLNGSRPMLGQIEPD